MGSKFVVIGTYLNAVILFDVLTALAKENSRNVFQTRVIRRNSTSRLNMRFHSR